MKEVLWKVSKFDLYGEIIAATKMILNSEGLSHIIVKVKPGVRATYHYKSKGKEFIQYGEESIEDKLDTSRGRRYKLYIYENGKLRVYTWKHFKQLTAKERIASVIIEEAAHAVARSEGYHGKHGGYFHAVFIRIWKKYHDKVMGMLPSVSKYEVVSLDDILARSARLKWKIKEVSEW